MTVTQKEGRIERRGRKERPRPDTKDNATDGTKRAARGTRRVAIGRESCARVGPAPRPATHPPTHGNTRN
ncbi:hypothetical protein J6590_020355 [Homalodisca vitripennis]|nr:hypothetical protein J6590_020355 [Homalodisca vitripennis]